MNFFSLQGIEPQFPGCPAHSTVTCPTARSCLLSTSNF